MERPYRPLIEESGFRSLVRRISYRLFYLPLFLILVPSYGLKVTGRENLKGPAVTVMNHCLHFEWFFLWHAARPRFIRFTAEQANMERRDAGWFNFLLGVIGIPDRNPMAMAPAVGAALDRRELVHFFPEGVLNRNSQDPGNFFVGAAWFACRHQVPLIPVAEVLHPRKISRWLRWWPPRVEIVVGKPVHPARIPAKGRNLRRQAEQMTEMAENWIRKTLRYSGSGSGISRRP